MSSKDIGHFVEADMERVFSALPSDVRARQPRRFAYRKLPGTASKAGWLLLTVGSVSASVAALLLVHPEKVTQTPGEPTRRTNPVSVPAAVVATGAGLRQPMRADVREMPTLAGEALDTDTTQVSASRTSPRDDMAPLRSGKVAIEVPLTPITSPSPVKARTMQGALAATSQGWRLETRICRRDRDHDACLHREIDGADDRLRKAYLRASEVSPAVPGLGDVRRTWDAALTRSREQPFASIQILDGLTTSLYNRMQRVSVESTDGN